VADDLNSYCCSHTESTEDTPLLCMRPVSLLHMYKIELQNVGTLT